MGRVGIEPTTLGLRVRPDILIVPEDNGLRICPVDWELAARGPGLLDLAALSAGRWSDDERDRLARAYFEAADGAASPGRAP